MNRSDYQRTRRTLRALRSAPIHSALSPLYRPDGGREISAIRDELRAQINPPGPGMRRDAELRQMAARWQNRRIHHERRRAERLHAERSAAALAAAEARGEFDGLAPFAAALKRLDYTWGCSHV